LSQQLPETCAKPARLRRSCTSSFSSKRPISIARGAAGSQTSSLFAALLRFFLGSFASNRCLLNRKVFELRPSLELLSQPYGLRSSACPGVALLIAIFDRHLLALHRASSASASTAYFSAKL